MNKFDQLEINCYEKTSISKFKIWFVQKSEAFDLIYEKLTV